MIGYYRDVEAGNGRWIEFQETELSQVKEIAYHMTPYLLSRSPDSDSKDPIVYKGDLWFEIDHKPTEDETIETALHRSIVDTQNLKAYFESIELNPDDCNWYISGGKGFHVCVPRKSLGTNLGYENLPLIHKYVAAAISSRADISGTDYGVFATGKGHTLRVENKQRGNGFYKVQILPSDLESITSENYFEWCSEPQETFEISKSVQVNPELSALFQEALTNFKRPKRAEITISSELFKGLTEPPICIKQVLARENIKASTGEFNSAKMSTARYLSVATQEGDELREAIITQFCDVWESSRFPTPRDREKELRAALRCFEGKEFNCSIVSSGLEVSPCKGCPLYKPSSKSGSKEGATQAAIVFAEDGVYKRATKEGNSFPISNFIISTITAFFKAEEPDLVESMLVSIKVNDSDKRIQKIIYPRDFQTKGSLKNATCQVAGSYYMGNDDDAAAIYQLLTNTQVLAGVKQMTAVRTLGVIHHLVKSRDIDEMVWVQEGWSVNTQGIEDTVHYSSPIQRKGAFSEHESVALDLKDTSEMLSEDAMRVFLALIGSRRVATSAQFLGFIAACWIKPILQREEYDNLFPALQVFGEPGSGKTSLTLRWAVVGGSNGSNTRSVSQCTPASLRTAGFTTTTVPVIFDEFNIVKCPKDRYTMAREVIKSSATKQNMEYQSKNGDGTLTQNSLVCSSPIITLGTTRSIEAEIVQRTEKVELFKSDISQGRDHPFHKNFTFVKKNKDLLKEIAGAFMRESLIVDREWLYKTQEDLHDKLDHLLPDNRENIIAQTILVGLEFAERVIKSRFKGKGFNLDQVFYELKNEYFRELESTCATQVKGKGELDNFFERLSQIASEYNHKSEPLLIEGIHFVKDSKQLHLKVISLFGVYRTWIRQMPNVMNEWQNPVILVEAMKKSPAFVGIGMNPAFLSPDDWVTLDLGVLVERGINVKRFDRKSN